MSVGQKARILYVEPFYWTGGPHNVLRNLLAVLDRDEFAPYAVVPRHGEATEHFNAMGIPVERLVAMHNIGRKGGPIRMAGGGLKAVLGAVQVALFARGKSVDVVHTNNETCLSGTLGARLAGRPSVVHVHGLGFSQSRATAAAVAGVLNATADRVVAVSAVVADALRNHGVKDSKIRVVHNGIDTDRFRTGIDWRRLRQEFGLSGGPTVGMIAELEPRKGHELFLNAATVVRKKHPEARFFVIGGDVPTDTKSATDSYRRRLADAVRAGRLEDSVVFTGRRTDIPELLSMLDVVVQPSDIEAGPLVPLESMGVGTPVVVTDVGANPEEVVDAETGIVVPPNDPRKMAEAIALLLSDSDLRTRMGGAGRRRVEDHFSRHAMAAKLAEIYRDVSGAPESPILASAEDGKAP
jgi:glycosyltransferase involved in cell wall biosynthesis